MSSPSTGPQLPVVGGADDLSTVALVSAHLADEPGQPVAALFFDDAVASIFRGMDAVEAVAWGPVLARAIVDELPPSPLHLVAPPPVVVGDGPMARLVAQAWIRGWAEPGQRLKVHCVGLNPVWAQEARDVTQPEGEVVWSAAVSRPEPVATHVRELVEGWDAPPPERGVSTGPSVVVAAADELMTVAIAVAIARELPKARVAAVVSGDTSWPAVPGVRLHSQRDAVTPSTAYSAAPTERLAGLILADYAWLAAPDAAATAPEAPLFGTAEYSADGMPLAWGEQPEALRAEVTSVAEACERILAAGKVALAPWPSSSLPPIVLTPGELSAMAEVILEELDLGQTPQLRLTTLELASRLPVFAKRAGLFPVRAEDYDEVLAFASVEALAPEVHYAYERVAKETNNATGSPAAYALWDGLSDFFKASNRAVLIGSAVAHAASGLDWRNAEGPRPTPLTDDQVRELGRLEHRRWAINERRNGRPDHKWAEMWDPLPEATKEYDYAIMRAVPGILALADVEVFRPR